MAWTLQQFLEHGADPQTPDILDLSMKGLGVLEVEALASSPHMLQLRKLDLSYNEEIGSQGAAIVAASPFLANLRLLDLSETNLGNAGAIALAAATHLASLQEMELSYNRIRRAGASALAASSSFPCLRTLTLIANEIYASSAKDLATSPFLASVRSLELWDNGIGKEGEASLEKRDEVQKSPAHAWKSKLPRTWRLFAYACLPKDLQETQHPAFLPLAKAMSKAPKGLAWSWCQRHLLGWAGASLEAAAACFPTFAALQELWQEEQVRRKAHDAALESALFSA